MFAHQIFFWVVFFFLGGLGLYGALEGSPLQVHIFIFCCVTLCVLLFFLRKRLHALLSLCAVIGALYYSFFSAHALSKAALLTYDVPVQLSGVVTRVVLYETTAQIDVRISVPTQTAIRITVPLYEAVSYGDRVTVATTLEHPPDELRQYYVKEGVSAVARFPKELLVTGHNQGSAIKSVLLRLREHLRERLSRVFSGEQAVLIDGLLLGKSSGFSRELKDMLQKTGTTHIVALSGYNIALIASGIMNLLKALHLTYRARIFIIIIVLCGFVLMTGAEASVVRASLMAAIVLCGSYVGRQHSTYQSIVVAALLMVLANPYILIGDVGFQLSFLALLGIVYLQPVVSTLLNLSGDGGFLGWKTIVLTTCCAQIAVLPLLLSSFGFFPLLSVLTNLLLLIFIPLTTALGFIVLFVSFFSQTLALLVSLPVKLLLGYELAVIHFFSQFDISFTLAPSLMVGCIYYAVLVIPIVYVTKTHPTS